MAGSSSSNSSGSSTSSSTPTVVQTPQSEWSLQLSQLLGAMTKNQYGWAMDQFNSGMGVTDANINNYMQLAGMGAGLAQNLLSRYQNVFEPLMNNYIQQAGSYNSADRQKFMMGQAESTAGQADQAARDSAERQLQSFGINPNSGRYQDLMLTSRMQDAATRAGAGTQASVNTAAIGRQMQEKAIGMGQNLPGMTVNALQSAYTGVTGAENAILGMLNTGANLTNSAANFGNAAANANKLPPVGQISTGNSQQRSVSGSSQQDPNQQNKQQPKQQQQTGQKGAGNGTGSGVGGQGQGNGAQPYASWKDPNWKAPQGDDNTGNATEGGLEIGGADPGLLPSWINNPGATDLSGRPNDPLGNTTSPDNTNWAPPNSDPQSGQVLPMGTGEGPGTNTSGVNPFQNNDPFGQGGALSGFGQQQPQQGGFDPGQPADFSQQDWGQSQQQSGGYQPQDFSGDPGQSGFQGQYQTQDQGQYQPQQQSGGYQPQGEYQPQNQGGFQGQDQGNYGYDQPQQQSGGYQPQDFSSDPGQTGFSGGQYQQGGYYAKGGPVRGRGVLPTSGGPVPRNASPSRGRVTDDIPARLNAGEFVIPRDVTAHMGTKHFQDVIAKSRKLRTGMAGPPARPKMKPALPQQRPTFTSQSMGQ